MDIANHIVIMLVDDQRENLEFLTEVFDHQGYQVRAFSNGERAFESARRNPPQIVIMDIDMPGDDGYRICEKFKTEPTLASTPVIFVSAFCDIKHKLKAFDIGGVDYITKPFDVEELKARVATHLRLVESDRMQKEMRRRKHIESQYFSQLEQLTDAVIHVNEAGKIVYHNSAALKLFDYTEHELSNRPVEMLIPESYREQHVRFRNNYLKAPANRKMGEAGYFSGRKKNGEVFPVEVNLGSLYTDKGILVSAEIKDRSAQHRAEADLHNQRILFEGVFKDTPDALILTDTNKHIKMMNPAACSMFGYSSREMLGQDPGLLFEQNHYNDMAMFQGDTERRAADCIYSESSDKGPAMPATTEPESAQRIGAHLLQAAACRRKNGDIFQAESIVVPVRDRRDPVGYLFIFRDVTERALAQREYEQLQSQLRQTQKMEALGQLTGGIAHDFNNMLCSILGFTELAMDIGGSEVNEYLVEVLTAGRRAQNLVSQMLTFSRGSESGGGSVCDLPPVVEESVKLLQPVLTASIVIDVHSGHHLPQIGVDSVQIQQLLMNLCINARDAMQGVGRIEITMKSLSIFNEICSACHENFCGDYVRLSVRDRGPGIDESQKERLFEPFFTTKDIGKGSGMGLAVVHGIMHDCHGHIMWENHAAGGSEFHLYFPALHETAPLGGDEGDHGLQDVNGTGKRIIVVDDEQSITMYLQELLEGYHFQVEAFSDGKLALEFIRFHPERVDLVITDQTMPTMTGSELAQAVFTINRHIPVILCTGFSTLVDEQKARAIGIAAYLQKPYSSETLMKTVLRLMAEPAEEV